MTVDVSFPLHTFPVEDIFVWRHEQGTLIEYENETKAIKRRNDQRTLYRAWPLAPIPGYTTAYTKSWLMMVEIPSPVDNGGFPTLSEQFRLDMVSKVERQDEIFSLIYLHGMRIPNPYESIECLEGHQIKRHAAFKVDVPRSWEKESGESVELDLMANFQIVSSIDDFSDITLDEKTEQLITIRWEESPKTFEAELAALRLFTEKRRCIDRGPSLKSCRAFQMLQNFHGTRKDFYNLHDMYDHLKDPVHPFNKIPKVLVDCFNSFNKDHRAAYDGLKRIPNGLYFVNGCPGSGKTHWNLILAALIQSKRPRSSQRKHGRILFLVDINRTVDDAADRYLKLCRKAGMSLSIIRMHGWPYEMQNSEKLNHTGSARSSVEESQLDFTKSFLTTASLARRTSLERSDQKAPNLDEAAWDYFLSHQDDCFDSLQKLLGRMDDGEAFNMADWGCLRANVSILYKAVLAQADFVATTPVAAYGHFSKLFRPSVVFIDEAPHARELTTLIPIAFFSPITWIFTGDVKQTRPFVKNDTTKDAERSGLKYNPFQDQLRYSTMARAATVGAVNSELLINKRAFGNLVRLPSELFYEGKMISGYGKDQQYPDSVSHLKKWLESFGCGSPIDENRIIVRLKNSQESRCRKSFWNPFHHRWLVSQVLVLLEDEEFRCITNSSQLGTVIIQAPYSSAFVRYQDEVKQWPQGYQDRVRVMTVDKAQGSESDVVFLDMVRTSTVGFMDDPYRLNVSITRARQAEVILMHENMTKRVLKGGMSRPTTYTSKMWDDAVAGSRMFPLSSDEKECAKQ